MKTFFRIIALTLIGIAIAGAFGIYGLAAYVGLVILGICGDN